MIFKFTSTESNQNSSSTKTAFQAPAASATTQPLPTSIIHFLTTLPLMPISTLFSYCCFEAMFIHLVPRLQYRYSRGQPRVSKADDG